MTKRYFLIGGAETKDNYLETIYNNLRSRYSDYFFFIMEYQSKNKLNLVLSRVLIIKDEEKNWFRFFFDFDDENLSFSYSTSEDDDAIHFPFVFLGQSRKDAYSGEENNKFKITNKHLLLDELLNELNDKINSDVQPVRMFETFEEIEKPVGLTDNSPNALEITAKKVQDIYDYGAKRRRSEGNYLETIWNNLNSKYVDSGYKFYVMQYESENRLGIVLSRVVMSKVEHDNVLLIQFDFDDEKISFKYSPSKDDDASYFPFIFLGQSRKATYNGEENNKFKITNKHLLHDELLNELNDKITSDVEPVEMFSTIDDSSKNFENIVNQALSENDSLSNTDKIAEKVKDIYDYMINYFTDFDILESYRRILSLPHDHKYNYIILSISYAIVHVPAIEKLFIDEFSENMDDVNRLQNLAKYIPTPRNVTQYFMKYKRIPNFMTISQKVSRLFVKIKDKVIPPRPEKPLTVPELLKDINYQTLKASDAYTELSLAERVDIDRKLELIPDTADKLDRAFLKNFISKELKNLRSGTPQEVEEAIKVHCKKIYGL